MARYALLNSTVIRGRNIVAGSIIDTIQESSAKDSLESKGGRLVLLPNADLEAAAAIAQERRRYGASIQELDAIMTAAASVALAGANVNLLNGSIVETIDIEVIESGGQVLLTLQRQGGGTLTVQLSGKFLIYAPGSVVLTAGTDDVPVLNYVWIEDQGGVATLVSSTSGWPSIEHAPIATVVVQSVAGVAADGAYKVHAWTDHVSSTNGQGHLSHINYWIRTQNASWESGVDPSLTIVSASSPDDVFFAVASGSVLQLHPHAFPARNMQTGDEVFVINDSVAPYSTTTNLNTLLTDSTGASMSGRYFSLVVWGVVSEDSPDCKLMVNLPGGSYGTLAELEDDAARYANYAIPSEYRGTGFLIAELKLRHQVIGGGTWTEIELVDLRGLFPSRTVGGQTAQASEFSDDLFRLFDNADATKKLAFEVSGITTGTTRTITVPDADITVDDTSQSRPPTGSAGGGLGGTYPNPSVNGMSGGVLANDTAHGNLGGGLLHAIATPSVAGFESAADKTKLDGIATGATNTPLTASAPVNVTKEAAVVGVAASAARADHKHDISTAAGGSISVGATGAEGTATSLARSDHTHTLAAGTPVNVTKAAAGAGTSGNFSRADHKHDISTAVPASIGAANSEGTATNLARSDHVHNHGSQTTPTHHAVATVGANGFMSSTDKSKLDGIQSGAQVNAVTSVFSRTGAVVAQVGDYSSFFLQLSGGTMTGDLNMGNQDVTNMKSASYNAEYNIGNSGTSFSINWQNGNKQVVSLNGNVTSITFSGAPLGATSLMLRVKQTGSFTIAGTAWPAAVKWVNGGTDPVITTGSGTEDILAFLYNSDSQYDGVQSPNFV